VVIANLLVAMLAISQLSLASDGFGPGFTLESNYDLLEAGGSGNGNPEVVSPDVCHSPVYQLPCKALRWIEFGLLSDSGDVRVLSASIRAPPKTFSWLVVS
jgi:hypothetical protein